MEQVHQGLEPVDFLPYIDENQEPLDGQQNEPEYPEEEIPPENIEEPPQEIPPEEPGEPWTDVSPGQAGW